MDHYADDEDVVTFWVNSLEIATDAYEFLASAGVDTTCLLDDMSSVHNSYDIPHEGQSWAPYPLQVVVDREGVITYLANEADPDAVKEAIEAAR